MTAYYNEIDPYAAAWLRNLIAAGHIADGVVDERSIEDVQPADLADFEQCHFFAGIGVWSHALRAAGWPDDRPVWTGSCPCQPFSAAGKGAGFADERHLWPAFHHLIRERRPAVVLGEQVASSHVDAWIDLVHADLEALGYAFGSVPFPSAGVGAPHIRDRNYWMANINSQLHDGRRTSRARRWIQHPNGGAVGGLGDANLQGPQGQQAGAQGEGAAAPLPGEHLRLADSAGGRRGRGPGQLGGLRVEERLQADAVGSAGPTNGFWRDADWLGCTDGRWRPVEPGSFPLVNGASGRVGRLRAYGNAINAEAARVFIEAVMGCAP